MLQALKETDRLRSALLQSVSHDLRTPLTAITASASALHENVPEHERDALLGGIEHEARRLVRLVDNMLDLSRIEAGALHPRRTLMPVDELLYAAVDDAAAALDGQFVDVDGAAELPPVNVDETMIRQVLVNLLENASRADPDDAIGLYAASAGSTLRITVVDHGPGVPEAERRRIFEPYYRLRKSHDHRAGTGLGLAISRGFVEAHGGTHPRRADAGRRRHVRRRVADRGMKRPLILLVDDEPVVLRALRVALEAQDYAVSAVLTGEDALARITNGAFDLVLLDLGLPGVDGFEVIRRVRVLYPALPIIVLSAQGEDAVKVEALDLGADDYVSKPFSVRGAAGARPRGAAPRRGRRCTRRVDAHRARRRLARSRRAHGARARRARAADAHAVRAARLLRAPPGPAAHASRDRRGGLGRPGRGRRRQPARADLAAAAAHRAGPAAPGADRDRARARLPLPRRTRRDRPEHATGPGPLGQERDRAVRVRRESGAGVRRRSTLCTIRSISLMPTNGRITPPAP